MQPILSIVIPVYKTPLDSLQNCLNSVLEITSFPIEVVCVLDSPGDLCEQFLDNFVVNTSKITLLKNSTNKGAAFSRNKGLKAVSGQYVTFVDADDRIDSRVYEYAIKIIKLHNLDLLTLGTRKEENIIETEKEVLSIDLNQPSNELLLPLIRHLGMSSCGILYNRNYLLEKKLIYPMNLIHNEDFVFVTKVLCTRPKVALIYKQGYYIVGHPNSVCRSIKTARRYIDSSLAAIYILRTLVESQYAFPLSCLRWYLSVVFSQCFQDMDVIKILQGEEQKQFSLNIVIVCKYLINNFNYLLTFPCRLLISIIEKRPLTMFSTFHITYYSIKLLMKINYHLNKY